MGVRSKWPLSRSGQNVLRFLVVLNLVTLGGTIGSFWQMSKSQDFRHTMRKRLPYVLEAYYTYRELGGYYGIREKDEMEWFCRKD